MKKVILITGASRGLGKVIYETLAKNKNYKVYGTSRKPLDEKLLKLDVTDNESVKKCIFDLIEIEGQIDVLVNNVGSNLIGSLEGSTIEDFQEEMNTSFFGTVRMIQEVMPYFRKYSSGRIINISSLGSKVPLPFNSTYSASKSALESMSESMCYELLDSDIRISIVAPIGLKIEDEIPNLNYIKNEKTWNSLSLAMFTNMKSKVNPSVTKLQVAQKVKYVIETKNPKFKYQVGVEARAIMIVHKILPHKVFYKVLKIKLFK